MCTKWFVFVCAQTRYGDFFHTSFVWVEGIPLGMSKKVLEDHFRTCGEVKMTVYDEQMHTALVYFLDVATARRAVSDMRSGAKGTRFKVTCSAHSVFGVWS